MWRLSSKYFFGSCSSCSELSTLSHFTCVLQAKRTNLKKPSSERTGHGLRVKFNPLALLLDASLEGEFDLVQRIIYEVLFLLLLQLLFRGLLSRYMFPLFDKCTASQYDGKLASCPCPDAAKS